MANFLSPLATRQFIDANGNPYTGSKLFTYAVGSSTKVTTFKDESGASPHANPIILNTKGEPADGSGVAYPIWQAGGTAMKYVLAPSTDTDPPVSPIETWNNIYGINDASTTIDQWIAGGTPTYVSATSFTLVGDQTTTYHVGRRLKTTNSGGTIYSTISVSAYTSLTTITVVNDSGTLDSGLSAVSYGILSAANNSVPGGTHEADTTWDGKTYFTNGIGPNYLQNISVLPSVASKALTVALKTKAGADASSTDPIQIAFRNATLTTGDYVIRNITAATSVVDPSGATNGFTASQTGYLYAYALDNAGTVEAALSGSNHWDEATLQSTTAISATADSGSVLYSTTARTNVPIRYIGRIKIQTGAVPGEWDNEDTEVTLSADRKGGTQGLTKVSSATTNIWNGGESCHIGGATVTMTIASPCVVTEVGTVRADQEAIKFTTTGTLPTGLVVGTQYYVKTPSGSTYNVSATAGGAAINTSGTQGGTHTVWGTITSFGTAPYAGATKRVIFDGVVPLTHGSNLNLPTGASITTAANDSCLVYADTTTQLDVLSFQRASGVPFVGVLASGTVIATTSGASADFTGIPAGTKEIKVNLYNVSDSSGSGLAVQIGDSGGLETTGYISSATDITSGTTSTTTTSTLKFLLTGAGNISDEVSGVLTLCLVDSSTNTWVVSGIFNRGGAANTMDICAGRKELSATLDRLSLQAVAGAFDLGKVNILYT